MAFHVGQKVVCIDANFSPDWHTIPWSTTGTLAILPTQGTIYTVRGSKIWHFKDSGDQLGLYLNEVVNPPGNFKWGKMEHPFAAWRFRPVVERNTEAGMAVLRKIADDASKKITEKV